MQKVRRVALYTVLAALVAVFGFSASAQAHDTNDWTVVSSIPEWPHSRFTEPVLTGVHADAYIVWNDSYDVVLQTYVEDTLRDGWCAIVQVRYEVNTSGTWAGHWHYRVPKVDCTDGDGGLFSSIYASRYSTRSVHARACIGYADGTAYSCTAWQ